VEVPAVQLKVIPPETEKRDEYQFDYRKAKPNRFAAALKKGGRLVVLDPDVAVVFKQPEAVNAVLRALLQTMPIRGELPAEGSKQNEPAT
jgi:hypothetical protein